MAYYRRKKKQNGYIGLIIGFTIFLFFFAKVYGTTILLILKFIGITVLIILSYYLVKFLIKYLKSDIPTQKTKQEDLAEKKARLQHYFQEKTIPISTDNISSSAEQSLGYEPLHVSQNVQSMEKQFFTQKINKTPKEKYHDNKIKGDSYEKQVGKYFESIGYVVNYRGLQYGRRDGGIDLIATKSNEILLIQCKAWNNTAIKQKHLKEFLGNCAIFLEDNPQNQQIIRKFFVTTSENSDYGCDKFIKEHQDKISYIIMPLKE